MEYNEERLLILNMLEQGKISTQEAYRLLEALDNSGGTNKTKDNVKPNSENDIWESLQDVGEKLEEKISSIVDAAEQKIAASKQKLDSKDLGKGSSLLDRILEKIDFSITDDYYTTNQNFTFNIEALENSTLTFEGINGKIYLGTHNGDDILVDATIRSKKELKEQIIVCTHEGDNLHIRPDVVNNIGVSYVITLPNKKIKDVNCKTNNGKIIVDGCNFQNSRLTTTNGKIEVLHSMVDNIEALTSNAKVMLDNCTAKNLGVKTSNGKIELLSTSVEHIVLKTSNAGISVNGFKVKNNVKAQLTTSNGRITFDTREGSIGYDITADTSHGSVNINLPNMIHRDSHSGGHSSKHVRVTSPELESFQNKLYLVATTTNGSINIG